MSDEEHAQSSTLSSFASVGKDFLSLLRDAALFALALLLVAFPTKFNSMLVNAGFEEGSIVGFKWKSSLLESNEALQKAQNTIADLQQKNDDLLRALGEANSKLADPSFKERFGKLEQENAQLQQATQDVQESVSRTIVSNAPLVEKARLASAQPTALVRPKSDYLVGVQTLGVPDAARQDLNDKLHAAGYSLHTLSASYEERQNWLAQRSTVLYYTALALPAAQELAGTLKDLTGQDFAVQRGSGLGVDPSQRDVTLFVHYIKR